MRVGVILLNFGEPESPTEREVVDFLERIFFANADLEGATDEEARRIRSRQLAEHRAPGLIAEYARIGRSPLNEQADRQARALARELRLRGHDTPVYSGFQFTPPLIHETVELARAEAVEYVVAIPVYPLCGPSTNVAALEGVQEALDGLDWGVELRGITGWHRHPLYLKLRAGAIRKTADSRGLDLSDPETRIVFSAHGTPMKYLDEGSRYVEYVEEFCHEVAQTLSVSDYELGYQNHSNRGIEWTPPNVEDVIRSVQAKRVIVDPVSFMHEQSETLAELDHELREEAEEAGLEFHRVPVPHNDPRLARVLADLVESQLPGGSDESSLKLGPCRCHPQPGTYCLNSVPSGAVSESPSP